MDGQAVPLLDAVVAAGFQAMGRSRQGRPISMRTFEAARLGFGLPGGSTPRLLLVGGVHGDEPSSVEALLELASRLSAAAPSGDGAPAGAGQTRAPPARVMIIPALNPDGLVAGRKNAASDVDLNRNFPARNFTRVHRPGYDPGPFPLSEPETSLLAEIIEIQAIDAVVAVHAPFGCVNFDGPAEAWAGLVAAASGWPVRENIGYPTPGSLGTWLGIDHDIPILTLELLPGPLGGFRLAAAAALDRACDGVGAADICARIARSPVNPPEIG